MGKETTLHFLSGFNNYFNSQVKKPNANEQLVETYADWIVLSQDRTNFNPNDNVYTTLTVNYKDLSDDVEIDYLLVTDPTDTNLIQSRWFITDRTRNLGGQWELNLKRDLLVDYYDLIANSDMFLNKATITTINDKFIFNSEGFNTNQIKQREVLLKDETGCGWLVGYVSTQSLPNDITVSIPAISGLNYPSPPISYDTLISYRSNGVYKNEDGFIVEFIGAVGGTAGQGWALTANVNGETWARNITSGYESQILFNVGKTDEIRNQTMSSISSQVIAQQADIRTALYAANSQTETRIQITPSNYDLLMNMNGNTYSDGTNIFTVSVSAIGVEKRIHDNIDSSTGAAYSLLYNIIDDYSETNPYHPGSGSGIRYEVYVDRLNINVERAVVPAVEATIKNSAAILKDAPYRMFACPVGEPTTTLDGLSDLTSLNGTLSKNLCTTIATLLGGTGTSFIYDLQYLPYCPAREFIDIEEGNKIFLGRGTEDIDYTLVKNTETDEVVQYLLWCSKSNFSFYLNDASYKIQVPNTVVDFKVANETQFCRLCSPNYSGTFEFKPTMNYGVNGFEVNCTYKPYQPYIHVNPIFNDNGLYGGDYNDQRGLVCTGDFSVAILDDAWIDYQIQNKSYYDAHTRQIESMQTQFNLQQAQQRFAGNIGAVTAGLSSFSAGLMGGSMMTGNLGVGLGTGALLGIGGGLLSKWGLEKDLEFNQAQHEEQIALSKAMFNFGIQNVQALPYSLGRVSAFTTNNKIFPFLEFFGCTEQEEDLIKQKLKYNGYTVQTITTINNYLGGLTSEAYLQGQVVRFNQAEQYQGLIGSHEADAISQTFMKGVYITPWE